MAKSTIGGRIREARENKELDQNKLASKLGVATRTLQRWEKGEQVPDAMSIVKIAEWTEANPHWLLTGQGEIYVQTEVPQREKPSSMSARRAGLSEIPLLSAVPGGKPTLIFHPDHVEKHIVVDDLKDPTAFALVVKGDSMSPRIEHGDIVVVSPKREVHNGDICVIRVDDEDTIKRIRFENGYVQLIPLNTSYEPMVVKKKDVVFIWKVVRVIKNI